MAVALRWSIVTRAITIYLAEKTGGLSVHARHGEASRTCQPGDRLGPQVPERRISKVWLRD